MSKMKTQFSDLNINIFESDYGKFKDYNSDSIVSKVHLIKGYVGESYTESVRVEFLNMFLESANIPRYILKLTYKEGVLSVKANELFPRRGISKLNQHIRFSRENNDFIKFVDYGALIRDEYL